MGRRSTKRVLEYSRLAMGFANVRAGTRVLMLALVQAALRNGGQATGTYLVPGMHEAWTPAEMVQRNTIYRVGRVGPRQPVGERNE